MAYDNLLQPGTINSMPTRNRIITGPMERAMANRDGSLNQRYIDYLLERAKGGAGLINIESTYVDPRGQGNPFQVGCHGDHVIPGLSRLTRLLHEEDAKVSVELYFAGRQSASTATLRQPLGPSAAQCAFFDPMPVPRTMEKADIDDVIAAFAAAARRCLAAGVDMIHLHGAHGYVLGQFLSPWTNDRADEYGGSLANRARFALEVYGAVREVVGPDYPIGYRISMEEFVPGGLTLEETIPFCQMLADAGIDLIDITGGVYESGSEIFMGPEREHGGFVAMAAKLKAAIGDSVPVSVTQKLNIPELADSVIADGFADYISMTRAFHADPHFVRKLEEDRSEDINNCIGCHTCLNMFFGRKVAHCAVNPLTTFERTRAYLAMPTERPRHVTVVGGGPAGMTAARLLALQGHRVTLHEASHRLGGQINQAELAAHDYGYFTRWLARQLEKLRVDIRLGSRLEAQTLAASPTDAIVVATGARGGYTYAANPDGAQTYSMLSAFDRDIDAWSGRVVLVGGDAENCFLAVRLGTARPDLQIAIVDPDAQLATNKMSPARALLIAQVDALANVTVHFESTVEEIGPGQVGVQRRGQLEHWDDVADIVIGGRVSNTDVYEELMALGLDIEVYRIGDCIEPRDIHDATHEAAEVAGQIKLRSSRTREEVVGAA